MKNCDHDHQGFASLLGLFLVAVIVFFMAYKALNRYTDGAGDKTNSPKKANNQTVLQHTKDQLKEIERQTAEREKNLLNW